MELTTAQCYEALKSRDARFDGVFFIGVLTTGIYCRPVCPARTPKRGNIRFFRHAAEAEATGLRPCLRCRPEAAPGTPAWNGTSATISRALRIIADTATDDFDSEGFAAKLGMSDRQVRRLFREHIGAPPIAVVQSHRVQFAKRLLTETNLSVTDIAFASGFGSLRRFNAAFKKTYGMPPRDVRRRSGKADTADGLTLMIAYRPPYDASYVVRYIGSRAFPGVESVVDGAYMRAVTIDGCAGIVRVAPINDRNALSLTVAPELLPVLPQIVGRVRRMFDVQCDPAAVNAHLERDETLRPLVAKRPGLRVPGAWCPFETTVRAVLGQQVSVKAANTLARRLAERYGDRIEHVDAPGVVRTFPKPERLIRARLETIGVMRARANTIRGLAKAFAQGELELSPGQPLEEIVDRLTALRGIGPWTAHYVAMRGYGDPDAFAIDDLGIIRALEALEGETHRGKKLERRAEAWRPWRAYATYHLWSSLSDAPKKEDM